jgi:hypothetical protein
MCIAGSYIPCDHPALQHFLGLLRTVWFKLGWLFSHPRASTKETLRLVELQAVVGGGAELAGREWSKTIK